MTLPAFYNEIDPYCCKVLRARIDDGLLPPGYVDERDIRDVKAADLEGYGQIHLFAGIGGFAYAARLAGWPDGRPVLTGGFPCQDITFAGTKAGINGARSSLWSEIVRLLDALRPERSIVENSSDLTLGARGAWFGKVLGDLAKIGFDAEWHCIPACAVNADHERDRIWIMPNPHSPGGEQVHQCGRERCTEEVGEDAASHDADDNSARPPWGVQTRTVGEDAKAIGPWLGSSLSASNSFPREYRACSPVLGRGENGIPHRVDRMHAIGNAIVPQVAEQIYKAIMASDDLAMQGEPVE